MYQIYSGLGWWLLFKHNSKLTAKERAYSITLRKPYAYQKLIKFHGSNEVDVKY